MQYVSKASKHEHLKKKLKVIENFLKHNLFLLLDNFVIFFLIYERQYINIYKLKHFKFATGHFQHLFFFI